MSNKLVITNRTIVNQYGVRHQTHPVNLYTDRGVKFLGIISHIPHANNQDTFCFCTDEPFRYFNTVGTYNFVLQGIKNSLRNRGLL